MEKIQYNTGSGGAFETVAEYKYDSGGRLYSTVDHKTGETIWYKYDPSGKLLQTITSDNTANENVFGSIYEYNEKSELTRAVDTFGYSYYSGGYHNAYDSSEYTYLYNRDGTLSLMALDNGNFYGNISPTYDSFGRTTQKIYSYGLTGADIFYGKISYQYVSSGDSQSALVSQYRVDRGIYSGNLSTTVYNYTYDDNGNITQIKDANGVILNQYWYDDLGQLIREDNRALDQTFLYSYDKAGNMLDRAYCEFSTTTSYDLLGYHEYEYGNSVWKDQLTVANGWAYTYDQIGNPIRKENYRHYYEYSWEGRKLETIDFYYDKEEYENVIGYIYNSDGISFGVSFIISCRDRRPRLSVSALVS